MTSIPIHNAGYISLEDEQKRAMRDLIYNADSKLYINEKGFYQKYIDLMYNLGYYKDNESVFLKKEKE